MNSEANKQENSKLLNGQNSDDQLTSSICHVSSSLMSISSKKQKNSSLSLNKKNANPTHFLNSIKNSTLNVFSKPLNLSRSPSPQMTSRKQFKPIDLEANIIVNNKLDLIESSEEEDLDQYEENLKKKSLSTEQDQSRTISANESISKAVKESDSDSDSNQGFVQESKLNMCSCSKPSLKTLSYSNANNSNSQIPIGLNRDNKFKSKLYLVTYDVNG